MQMRKGNEGQGTARSVSKPAGTKPTGEQASPGTGKTETNQGTGTSRPQAGGEQDLLQHAKKATGEIVNQVQERAGSQLKSQKETAAAQLSQVANAFRRIRETLGEEETGPIGRYVGDYGEKAADGIERFSTYIREQDPKQLLNDVQNFGRRQPAIMLGGAFLLGFAGARLIKSVMNAAYEQQWSGTEHQRLDSTGADKNLPTRSRLTAPDAR